MIFSPFEFSQFTKCSILPTGYIRYEFDLTDYGAS